MAEVGVMYRNVNLIQLYRHIIKAAKRFPSSKRDKIVEEIRICKSTCFPHLPFSSSLTFSLFQIFSFQGKCKADRFHID